MSPEYQRKQGLADARYQTEYQDWVNSLTLADKRKLDALGLADEDMPKYWASHVSFDHTPEELSSVDPRKQELKWNPNEDSLRIASVAAVEIISKVVPVIFFQRPGAKHPHLLTNDEIHFRWDCLRFATGFFGYDGLSQNQIAALHGRKRQVASFWCRYFIKTLHLPAPARMRNDNACARCREASAKGWETRRNRHNNKPAIISNHKYRNKSEYKRIGRL